MQDDAQTTANARLSPWIKIVICALLTLFYGDACRRVWSIFATHDGRSEQMRPVSEIRVIDHDLTEVPGAKLPLDNDDSEHDFSQGPKREWRQSIGRYVFTNERGELAFPGEFVRARPFSEGLAAVSDVAHSGTPEDRTHLSFGSKPWRYIDRTGKVAFARQFARVSEFRCGRAVVTTMKREWNPICVDTRGKTVFKTPAYTEIFPYCKDGHAVVSMGWPPSPNGLVDRDGNLLVQDVKLANFAEGLGAFRDRQTGRFGYMDARGKVVIQPNYFKAGSFSDGLAPVAYADTAPIVYEYSTCAQYVYGYIDKSGKLLDIRLRGSPGPVHFGSTFHNGRASVTVWPNGPPSGISYTEANDCRQ